ncbi:PseudoU_synth_2 domain-containing protein, partial [Haematococcus lacustris]
MPMGENLAPTIPCALGLQPGSLHPAHRLDGGTSGVVLLSRTPAFARYFQQQVQAKPGAEGEATPGVAGAAAGTGAGPEAGQGSGRGLQEAAGTTADNGRSSRQGGRAAKEHSGWQQQQQAPQVAFEWRWAGTGRGAPAFGQRGGSGDNEAQCGQAGWFVYPACRHGNGGG